MKKYLYLFITAASIALASLAQAGAPSYAPQWATTAECQAGVSTTKTVNPAGLAAAIANIAQTAPVGILVGRAYATENTNLQLTTSLPIDDTIPQVTEGTAVTSISYAAKKATDRIRITFTGTISTAAVNSGCALFYDGGANAIAAALTTPAQTGTADPIMLIFEKLPGDTSSHTYAIRCGTTTGATSVRMNGSGSARFFGGVAQSVETLDEFTE